MKRHISSQCQISPERSYILTILPTHFPLQNGLSFHQISTAKDSLNEEIMEGETEQNDNTTSRNDTSWSATTNWTIADGSLVNSITFESTLSPTTDDNGNRNSAENSTPQSPLVLCPPSTDQTPCEISSEF